MDNQEQIQQRCSALKYSTGRNPLSKMLKYPFFSPPTLVSTDQNALEQQLKTLGSRSLSSQIVHTKCNTFSHFLRGVFRKHPGKCTTRGKLREKCLQQQMTKKNKSENRLDITDRWRITGSKMAVSRFSSMWSINIIGVGQACKQPKETHLRMAQTGPVTHVFV